MNTSEKRVLCLATGLVVGLVIQSGCTTAPEPATEKAAAAKESAAAPAKKAAPVKPQPRTATLAEGTELKVRTTNALSTDSHKAGDTFTATLEEPLTDGNWVIAEKGAKVDGAVVDAGKGGRVEGRARLAVRLTQVRTSDGQTVEIATNSVARQAKSTTKEDATKVGIGAGIGAVIGAIAGGGKGAAIGAATGAGAGTGVVLATRGDPAVLPSETVLSFRLRNPVTVTSK